MFQGWPAALSLPPPYSTSCMQIRQFNANRVTQLTLKHTRQRQEVFGLPRFPIHPYGETNSRLWQVITEACWPPSHFKTAQAYKNCPNPFKHANESCPLRKRIIAASASIKPKFPFVFSISKSNFCFTPLGCQCYFESWCRLSCESRSAWLEFCLGQKLAQGTSSNLLISQVFLAQRYPAFPRPLPSCFNLHL